MYQLVHSPGPESGADSIHNRTAGIDVADQLRLSLAGVRSFLQEDDLRLLHAKMNFASALKTNKDGGSEGCRFVLRGLRLIVSVG